MKSSKIILFFIPIIAFIAWAFVPFSGESEFLKTLEAKLKSYHKVHHEEKVYVHTNQSFYFPGETIWFKTYLANAENHRFSQLSDIIYVELIDPKGNSIEKLSLKSESGIAVGEFEIAKWMTGGIYQLVAHTRWMKNAGESTYFKKNITVQKVVKPRVLMKLDFQKKAYGKGDWVKADFEVRNLEDQPITNQEIKAVVSLAGKKWENFKFQTDSEGKATVEFQLPEELESNDALLNILLTNEGNRESISRSIPVVLNKINLQFFPEGGDLISEVAGQVAFKATNEFGKPADISGIILDEAGQEQGKFESFHFGMGKFELQPKKGKKYFAKITKPAGVETSYELPNSLKSGFAIRVEMAEKDQIQLKIYAPENANIDLVGQTRGEIHYSKSLKMKKGWNELFVKTVLFPTGIAQFTLFDSEGRPQAERLSFLNKAAGLNIRIKTNKEQYQPRELVKMEVETTDSKGKPVPSNLSLAVVDDKLFTFADDKQHNILSWLLVGSDLKGKIEEPNFYFKSDEPKAEKALDLLLMTQGWRKFKWKEILEDVKKTQFLPETRGVISGTIIHRGTRKPVKSKVQLMELVEGGRMESVKTDENGKFTFAGVNGANAVQVLASSKKHKAHKLEIVFNWENKPIDEDSEELTSNFTGNDELIPSKIEIEKQAKKQKLSLQLPRIRIGGNNNSVSLGSGSSLQEVVVTGYGMSREKQALGYSVAEVDGDVIRNESVINSLQGSVAGVQVVEEKKEEIAIRGSTSSLASNGSVLYVIDGIPQSENGTGFQDISPSEISSITVLKGAAATAIYGSRAVNGVIVITTEHLKTRNSGYYRDVKKPSKFASAIAPPLYDRYFYHAQEFFVPDYKNEQEPETQTDFRNTIYWEGNLQTDSDGKAKVEFYNSDASTTFRVVAEGMSIAGEIGRKELTYSALKGFSLDIKMPPYVVFGDSIRLPIILKNGGTKAVEGNVYIEIPPHLKAIGKKELLVGLESKEAKTVYMDFLVLPIEGEGNLTVGFTGKGIDEAISKPLEIKPKGFPTSISISGTDLQTASVIELANLIEGSLKAKLTAYPNIEGELMAGVESILREPYGCFEQTSSSTYPNIMVKKYLQEKEVKNEALYARADELIQKGYKRLLSFETSSEGYEWFGHSPGHEALTAYGLMEFADMKMVYDGVSEEMIERTANWLLSKKNGQGGFKRNLAGYGHIGRADERIANAYILYALSEAGYQTDLTKEVETALKSAKSKNDSYEMALVANLLFNRKDSRAGEFLSLLNKNQEEDGSFLGKKHSITCSTGQGLILETTSLAILANLKAKEKDWKVLNTATKFLLQNRSAYGGYGNSQSTVLALKALTEFSKVSNTIAESGDVEVWIAGKLVGTQHFEKNQQDEVEIKGLEKYLKEGSQNVEIRFKGVKKALPYTLAVNYSAKYPTSSKECKVALKTKLTESNSKVGETVRMEIELQNVTSDGLPSTVAIVGIPSGLSPQPWQLKELIDEKQVDFYEIKGNYLIFYYTHLQPNAIQKISLDLKSEIPGNYEAPASTAYLYYTNEFRNWQAGTMVSVEE